MATLNQLPINVPPSENANEAQATNCCWPAVAGMSIALITSLALGLIFGPLAALAGFCAGGIVGIILATELRSRLCKNYPEGMTHEEFAERRRQRAERHAELDARRAALEAQADILRAQLLGHH